MTVSSGNTTGQTPAPQEGLCPLWTDGLRQDLLMERSIALAFGDARRALELTRDLRGHDEALSRGSYKGARRGSRNSISGGPSSDPVQTKILPRLEEDAQFLKSLRNVVLRFGDFDLAKACANELAILERQAAILRPDPELETSKGIRALMGVT